MLGDVTEEGKLQTLREVDEIFINTIREYGLYDEIWQAFAVFLPLKSVGVQVRGRPYWIVDEHAACDVHCAE